jgi:hypothetical protein
VGRGSGCWGKRGDGLVKRRRVGAVRLKSEVEDGRGGGEREWSGRVFESS